MDWKKWAPIALWVIPGGIALSIAIAYRKEIQEMIANNIFPNNNPGNIRPSSTPWLGQVGVSEKDFVQFDTVENGLRALQITALGYQLNHGINNLLDFGDRWAPPASIGGDNVGASVGQYGRGLASTLEVDPKTRFDLTTGNPFSLSDLAYAIVVNENGSIKADLIPNDAYDQGQQMAMAHLNVEVA